MSFLYILRLTPVNPDRVSPFFYGFHTDLLFPGKLHLMCHRIGPALPTGPDQSPTRCNTLGPENPGVFIETDSLVMAARDGPRPMAET